MTNFAKDPVFNFILKGQLHYEVVQKDNEDTPPHALKVFGNGEVGQIMNTAGKLAASLHRSKRLQLFCCLGSDEKGVPIVKDLAKDVRQLLVTGLQGSGKSNAVTFIIMSLLWGNAPQTTKLFIFDVKNDYAHLDKVAKVVSSPGEIGEAIKKLKEQLLERAKSRKKLRNITEVNHWKKQRNLPLLERIVIVIDEYSVTSSAVPNLNEDLQVIANSGRSEGFYLIIITQRADRDQLPPAIKANASTNLAFRQRDHYNAQISGEKDSKIIKKQGFAFLNEDSDESKQVHFPFISLANLKRACSELSVFFKGEKSDF